MKTLQQHIYENIFHKSEIYENIFHKSEIYENIFHKSEINEKLIINKNFKPMILCKSRQHLLDIIEQRLDENEEEPYLSDIDTSNINNMVNLFSSFNNYYCIKRLDLSSWNVENVTTMGGMFCDCGNLEYIDLTGWNTKSLEKILSMFYDCSSLKEIKGIEDFDITLLRVNHGFGQDAFYNVNEKVIPRWWYTR